MDAGRHGGYYNEFRENEADFDVSNRKIPNFKGEYERLKNGNNIDYDRGRNGARGSRDKGRVRGYNSASSRSDSGGSSGDGGLRHRDYPVRIGDREPGELSNDSGSDEAVDLGKNDNDFKIEEVSHSQFMSKKRKFSPIVWDRDDKEVSSISKSRFSAVNNALPLPPVSRSYQQSPDFIPPTDVKVSSLENDTFQNVEHCPVNIPIDIVSLDSYGVEPLVGLSVSTLQKGDHEYVQNAGQPEDEDYVPAHNIRSSRWANDASSPVDKGEISGAVGNTKGFEGTRAQSTDSNENGYRIRSSSSDDYPEKDLTRKDFMEIDEDHGSDGPSVSQSYSDSESEDDSHGTPHHPLPPQRSVNMLLGCRSVDEFERLNKIDEGTYGVVYRAKDKKTEEVVALKKVKMEREREGFPLTSLREINILLSFDHPSVVDVKEVVVGSNLDSIFMVMEYMEHDLKALMETMKQPFSQSEVKCLMLQLLEGTKYLHDNWVLHRDLKTSNLLLNNRGELKICDFGLSRQYGSPLKPYTHLVVTLWYRAPELLLGAKQYSTAIDMWSLGCIMAEFLSKQPLFNGKTEFDQLDKIFKTLGTPNETIWPGFSKLPGVKLSFVKHQLPALGDFLVWLSGLHWYNLLRRKFPATSFTGSPVLSDAGFDLLNKLLTYNPEKRITAEAALNHEWFREVPLPKSKDFMPTFPAHHAQDRRTRRVMKSPDPLEEQRRKELQQARLGTGGLFG